MARDDRWKNTEGTWDRLRWARLQKYGSAEDAAVALGEKPGTYRAYERRPDSSKHIPLDALHAMHFGQRLGVRWEWLLVGQGEPWYDPDPNRERILLAYDQAEPARRETVADAIERLLKTG